MALVQADVVALSKSWVVRVWLLVLLMSFLAVPVAMLVANGPGSTPASAALAAYLAVFLNVWSIVIIVLSAGSVSLESEIVADSILSRACTRTQYILAKLTSRALVVGGVYLLGASGAAYVSWRYGAADVTFGTMVSGIAIVGLALLMLVSLGVTMSAIFNNTIVSIVGLLLLWHVAGTLFAFAGVQYMSPASLSVRLPEILRDPRAPQVVSCSATSTSVSVIFSKDVNPDSAEQLDNYTVEDPTGTRHVPQTAVYDPATATVRLSGLSPQVTDAVTVTVDGVTDTAGNDVSPAANEATSRPPAATSKEEPEAAPADEASSRPSEEGPAANGNEEGVTPTPGSAAAEPPRSTRNRTVEGVTGGAGIAVSFAAYTATPSLFPATAEGEPEVDPPAESPHPPPEESPDLDRDEEEVAPTPGPAPGEPPGSSRDRTVEGATDDAGAPVDPPGESPPPSSEERANPNRTVDGVADGAGEVVTPAANEATPRPSPAASEAAREAGPVDVSPPPSSEETADANRSGGGVTPTPTEAAPAESDGASDNPTDRPPRVTQVKATRTTVSVTFSQDMDPVQVEELGNYTVESPLGTTRLPAMAAYDPSQKMALLSGLSFAPGDPVKVTVENMTARGGAGIDPRHNSATFSEVQNWKYLVGFGVPALLFALVGVVWFSWRDL